jgi:hypothetical protein
MSSSLTIQASQQLLANSTTYIDLLGVTVGLTRMAGESSVSFSERVRRAAISDRSASYRGLMNEICLQFGLDLFEAIEINGPIDTEVSVSLAGVRLMTAGATQSFLFPLSSVDPDGFWKWASLSDVVAAINASVTWQAALKCQDGPSFQLVQQNNVVLALNESITGQIVQLKNPYLIPGTEVFNQSVPPYALAGSVLTFASPIPSGINITYRHLVAPYTLIGSPVFLMSMLDPEFGQLAKTSDGDLTYQTKELVNELLQRDASYWTL